MCNSWRLTMQNKDFTYLLTYLLTYWLTYLLIQTAGDGHHPECWWLTSSRLPVIDIILTAGDGHHPDCQLISEAAVDATDMARTMAADVKKKWEKRDAYSDFRRHCHQYQRSKLRYLLRIKSGSRRRYCLHARLELLSAEIFTIFVTCQPSACRQLIILDIHCI